MGLNDTPGKRMAGNETDAPDPGLMGENASLPITSERFSVAELASRSNNSQLLPNQSHGTPADRPGNLQGSAMESLPAQLTAADCAADSLRRCDAGNI
jgi:hypothetical protein